MSTNLVALKNLAREIANNWETIDLLEGQLLDRGGEWQREMALQGQRLIHAKTQLKHGEWLQWCGAHAPGNYEKIKRCMRIATNWERVPNLSRATSLRNALALCHQENSSDQTTTAAKPRRWAPAIEAVLKLSKLCGYVERFPIINWPNESQDAAREKLLPVAAALWPAKFSQ